jgi:hypothetical protein
MRSFRFAMAAAAAMAASSFAVAQAQSRVTAAKPQTIVSALEKAGYEAELGEDSEGDPKVRTTLSGLNVNILFYGCNDRGASCRSLQLVVAFARDEPLTLQRVNDWNARERWGTMSLDEEGDPNVTFDIATEPNGIDYETFESILSRWETVVANLKEHIWD